MKSPSLSSESSGSIFERIRHVNASGAEYWSARELARALEYSEFRHFLPVIAKARDACAQSSRSVADHIEQILDMVDIGSGARRSIEDWRLSRYACYLVIQNADPSKPLVALGQTYFAVQTRRQELPENLPIAESIRKVERREKKRLKAGSKLIPQVKPESPA